ncbi:jg6396 [Pararge aegeria aegeria]|uniref:Jg6396 protein n=1 Tax=Pararge aegeria aegeria TaxID=348720 RepID=A0A8S4RQY7_9NEOP|nr:jg6396 [Pararge aegeria aegeria]
MAKLKKCRKARRCRGKMHHFLQYLGGAVCECRTAMSHHSDEQALLTVTSDSFWEPGNYKRTTRRVDDGHRLCSELQALVQERADIEKTYAKSLRGWAKKWNDLIEKGPEYGTMEAAWKGGMVEAERLSDLHLSVRDRLVNDVIAQIKNWQKDTYHKLRELSGMQDSSSDILITEYAQVFLSSRGIQIPTRSPESEVELLPTGLSPLLLNFTIIVVE